MTYLYISHAVGRFFLGGGGWVAKLPVAVDAEVEVVVLVACDGDGAGAAAVGASVAG